MRRAGSGTSAAESRLDPDLVDNDDDADSSASQTDTEPLPFEDGEEGGKMDEKDQEMLEGELRAKLNGEEPGNESQQATAEAAGVGAAAATEQHSTLAGSGDEEAEGGRSEEGNDEDVEMDGPGEEVQNSQQNADNNSSGDVDAAGSIDDAQEEEERYEMPESEVVASQELLSPSKSGQEGANFSDESELTDEPDDNEDEEEGEEDDEDEEDEDRGDGGEGEEEEDDDDAVGGGGDEDEDDEGDEDEDEAAEGLAALTSGQTSASLDGASGLEGASSGLDGLAVLAAAEAEEEDSQAEDDTDNDSIAESHSRTRARGKPSAIPRRTTTRLNEMVVASPAMSEDDIEEEGDEEEDNVSVQVTPKKGNREMSSLLGLSSAAKRTSKPGLASGLLAGAPSITIEGAASAVPSTATSREVSPKAEGEEEEGEEDEAEKLKNALENEQEEPGTPAQELDEVGAEDEPSTDEAALRRQEAMEALTKIEIGFALLRDKLYVERMDEVSKEGEMILEGTHPDLVHLSNLIEMRREKKLKLVERWFEQQEKQYERVAKTEEAAAWNNWRNEVVELRRSEMNDLTRKRRKLDREKKTLDVPRPARRHQIFETELIRNPQYDRKLQQKQQQQQHHSHSRGGAKGKPKDEENEMGAYVAYPDLRGADDHESWMDMERMGIDARFLGGMNPGPYYRADEMGMDPYAMYAMDQQRPPHSAASSTGFGQYGPPPGAEYGMPYDRPYDARLGPPEGHPPMQGYMGDNYGRLPSPPLPHAPSNGPPPRDGHRGVGDSYGGMDHPHSYGGGHHPRAGRRSPSMDGREVKNNGGKRGAMQSSPPPPSIARGGVSSRPPSGSQYAKYEEGLAYKVAAAGAGHPNPSRIAMQGAAQGAARQKAGGAESMPPSHRGRPADHSMYSR